MKLPTPACRSRQTNSLTRRSSQSRPDLLTATLTPGVTPQSVSFATQRDDEIKYLHPTLPQRWNPIHFRLAARPTRIDSCGAPERLSSDQRGTEEGPLLSFNEVILGSLF